MRVWRISDYKDLDGTGGLFASGRWHSKGRRVVYTAENSTGALSELLVHLDRSCLSPSFQLLTVEVAAGIAVEELRLTKPDWRNDLTYTRGLGDRWLADRRTPLLRVPSAIVPDAFNILINPEHEGSRSINVVHVQTVPLDPRLV